MSPGSFTKLVELVQNGDSQAKKALSERFFPRMFALVRTQLYSRIRGDKDVLVLDSILDSVVLHHTHDTIDWNNEEDLMQLIGRVALRHCDKHNKRLLRDPEQQASHLPIGAARQGTDGNLLQGIDPADDQPPPDAVVEFADFLGHFTPRQQYIIHAILDDVAQIDIASALGCAPRTVARELDAIRNVFRTCLHATADNEVSDK